jgi:hypothetical protein
MEAPIMVETRTEREMLAQEFDLPLQVKLNPPKTPDVFMPSHQEK